VTEDARRTTDTPEIMVLREASLASLGVALLVVAAIALRPSAALTGPESYAWPETPFWRIKSYLSQFGINAGESELSVSFDNGRVAIHDGAAHLYGGFVIHPIDNPKATFLHLAPNVSWPTKPGMEYAVIFTDMGPATGELSSPSAFFPFIHSFWAECSGGSLATCKTGPEPYISAPEGYRSPGNFAESANRYTFILFEPPAGTRLSMGGFAGAALAEKLAEAKAALVAGDQAKSFQALGFLVHFDFAQFGVENPSYKAVRWNYMMVNHRK
jgi:hypothetical protein